MSPTNAAISRGPGDHYQVVEDVLAPGDVHEAYIITPTSAANRAFVTVALLMTAATSVTAFQNTLIRLL